MDLPTKHELSAALAYGYLIHRYSTDERLSLIRA